MHANFTSARSDRAKSRPFPSDADPGHAHLVESSVPVSRCRTGSQTVAADDTQTCLPRQNWYVTRDRDSYWDELEGRLDAIFQDHPELYDHRSKFPWVLACLGDPFAPVWFVAENPSLTQVERAREPTSEDQWNVSVGDKLFRQQLVEHGFKTGTVDSPGGWRCYITDVIKSIDRVSAWNKLPQRERDEIAEAWAPVLAWELEVGQPKIIVSVGNKADKLLNYLLRRQLIPAPPRWMKVDHYSYIGSRPDARTGLGPRHPDRIAAWSSQFVAVQAALEGRPGPPVGQVPIPSLQRKRKPKTKPPRSSRTYDPIEVPEFVRDGIRGGLTPDQIYARNGRRRAIYLAVIVEEARLAGELAKFDPTPAQVARLRDRHGHRWERIAVRVFGDPRGTREAMDLYDEAKGKVGAAQEWYTGRGRRFPKMKA